MHYGVISREIEQKNLINCPGSSNVCLLFIESTTVFTVKSTLDLGQGGRKPEII